MTGSDVEAGVGGENGNSDSLFEGKRFWLSQNVPQRSRFKELIERNGGVIKLQEKDADVKIVDDTRKNLPSDTYSFKFVEDSIRNGRLADLEAYRAGPSAPRPVGATHIPNRAHKVPYTISDDQMLFDWLQPLEKNPRAAVSGNVIYKEIAEKHPRHTWQSYRDRYLRRLRGRPRPGGGMTASTDQRSTPPQSNATRTPVSSTTPAVSEDIHNGRPPVASREPEAKKRKRDPEPDAPERTEANGTSGPPPKRIAPVTLSERTPVTQHTVHESPTTSALPDIPWLPSPPPFRPIGDEPKPKGKEQPSPAQAQVTQQPPTDQPDSIPSNILLELPFFPSSPESQEEASEQGDIDTWIEDRLRTGKAANEEEVIEALQCTSMDPRLADTVLGFLRDGRGIPENMPGVWTPKDDECVEKGDSRAIEQVLKKHGSDSFKARWEYLSMARAAGDT
ncbi:putative transcription factor Rap1 [Aspergillus clavatus NRRL 1]|uniref:DNA-binding protein RAP1 n=1 Tax=Aspergillus clavatus (strain ATCC 1007 / CBS 513.65 / DSM 816 / NCTC 3887 / NRRL 1 / QM 1276 / 107) TaxID=344612 RepID=A1CT45_ASPCL|nr:uncharacterized protein ACLA_081720 [Aspergillus clavatus NRRL 1]EAW06482.1 conserved hypothetical protein [Aspergillus clavatus NRRL 1]